MKNNYYYNLYINAKKPPITLFESDDGEAGVSVRGGAICIYNPANSEYYKDTPAKRFELVEALKYELMCVSEWSEE